MSFCIDNVINVLFYVISVDLAAKSRQPLETTKKMTLCLVLKRKNEKKNKECVKVKLQITKHGLILDDFISCWCYNYSRG